jgi:NAD(P)-dependent dehydrogenase (short-subunit alcohol dehydrogenase family)
MARVFITGSTQGLGRSAALALLDLGHEVVVHARNASRAQGVSDLADRGARIVVGDLASADETHAVAAQVNAVGLMDAVIHNAGIYLDPERVDTPEGHARTLAVNVLAPYLLTCEIERPARLIYINSDLHHGGDTSLHDIDWRSRRWSAAQAYADSKLFLTTLAFALSHRWPDVYANVVCPGWVPTRMGGPRAPDDLELGHTTQVWLAVGDEPEAAVTGGYWYHGRRQAPAAGVTDPQFQDALLEQLGHLTGTHLP